MPFPRSRSRRRSLCLCGATLTLGSMPNTVSLSTPLRRIEPYTCRCGNGTDECSAGQSCFWFSQGVSVGCKAADGNGTRLPNLDHCADERAAGFEPLKMPGALDPKYMTTNVDAKPGTVSDIWKFNPWRAPGKGPLASPCGMAGGTPTECFNAGAYNATPNAKQGDLGTQVLKPRPMGVTWKVGSVERTRIEVTAQHGGGYIYQLCPAATVNKGFGSSSAAVRAEIEECFASAPLKFAPATNGGYTHLVVHPDPSKDFEINATIVAEGGGAGWAVHPWPYSSGAACDWNPAKSGEHCKWGCPRCGAPWWSADGACPDTNCEHSTELPKSTSYGKAGTSTVPFPSTKGGNTVEDRVIVPNVKPGEYVLRWRWGVYTRNPHHSLMPRDASDF